MKLSEISTDRGLDVLCELTEYINNIVTDEELTAEIKHKIDTKDVHTQAELIAIGVQKVNKVMPIIFKKRKQDVLNILAVLNEKTPEEISKQNFLVTANQVREIVKDKELIDFFKSCMGTEGND